MHKYLKKIYEDINGFDKDFIELLKNEGYQIEDNCDITEEDLIVIIQVNQILELFSTATKILEGSEYVTISRVINFNFGITNCLNNYEENKFASESWNIITLIKNKFNEELEKIPKSTQEIYFKSNLLDPRYKLTLKNIGEEDKKYIIYKIKEECKITSQKKIEVKNTKNINTSY